MALLRSTSAAGGTQISDRHFLDPAVPHHAMADEDHHRQCYRRPSIDRNPRTHPATNCRDRSYRAARSAGHLSHHHRHPHGNFRRRSPPCRYRSRQRRPRSSRREWRRGQQRMEFVERHSRTHRDLCHTRSLAACEPGSAHCDLHPLPALPARTVWRSENR